MREVYSAAWRSSESRESLQPRAACVRRQKRVEKPVGVEDANEGLRDVGGGDTHRRGETGRGWHEDILRRWKKAQDPDVMGDLELLSNDAEMTLGT